MKKVIKAALVMLAAAVICFCFSTLSLAAKEDALLNLKAENSPSGISLDWSDDKSATLYKVYRKGEKDKKRILIAKASSSSYTDKAAEKAKRYSYSVVPVYKNEKDGQRSNEVTVTRLSTPAIKKYTNTAAGIRLYWTKSEGATGYRVYRKNQGAKKWKLIGKTTTAAKYTDKTASTEANYLYMVKGFNKDSVSYKSNYLKADFTKSPEIKKISSNKKSISIYWQKDPKAVSYNIYRTDPDKKELKLYKKVKADTLRFTDENVEINKKYGYAVRTVNKSGKKSALPSPSYCPFMKAPKITSAQNATNGVKLSWTKSPAAQSYNVYRRSAGSDTWKKIINTKSLSATDSSVLNAKKYVYIVRAVYNKTQSAYYQEGISIQFVSAPTQVNVQFVSKTSNKITWAPNRSATAYNVYRRHENSTEWTKLTRTTKTSYTDKNVKKGELYYYFVRAYIKSNKSAASSLVLSSLINPSGKFVALTYDDGPSNLITNRVLDTLEKHGAKATFFVLGSRIDANYKPMKRAVKLGCEIGNHTYNHIDLPSNKKDKILSEISMTNSLVKEYTGVVPKLARAPGGSTDSFSRKTVNMPFIYWSIDTRDWETMNASAIIAHVKNETRDGSIILMHDVYEATADATEVIVPWLIKQGYQLVTVSEIMQYRGIKLQKGVTYYNAYK